MFQYIIDIPIDKLKVNIIDKLIERFHHTNREDTVILSENGLYKIIDDKIYKFSLNEQNNIYKIPIIEQNGMKISNIIKQNIPFKKNKFNENWIPPNHESIQLNTNIFKLSKDSNTELHIVMYNDKINDIYILSNLDETQHSFKEDLELFYRILI